MNATITKKAFDGEMAWASNFYEGAPIIFDGSKDNLQEIYTQFKFDGLEYPTTEHLFQALKATNDTDKESVRLCATPGQSKKKGRQIFIRLDWDHVKYDAMRLALFLKFSQHQDLLIKLLETNNESLVEYNSWGDKFWGVCDKTGKGENWLGRLLMELRSHSRLVLRIK